MICRRIITTEKVRFIVVVLMGQAPGESWPEFLSDADQVCYMWKRNK